MYTKKEAEKVWNGWTQMKRYLEKGLFIFEKSEGIYFIDQKGNKVIDGTANLLSSNLGHNNKYVSEKVMEQLNKLDSCSLICSTSSVAIQCSEKILSLFKGSFHSIFYTNSGSEACDTAIKIAQQYHFNKGMKDKNKIISFKGCYHGCSLVALNLAKDEYDMRAIPVKIKEFLQATPASVSRMPKELTKDQWVEESLKDLENLILKEGPDTVAAMIIEPVQLSNAVDVIYTEYFEGMRQLCNKYSILLIFDEVATGFGRLGTMFGLEYLGVEPDILMLAKSITNGVAPLGAVVTKKHVYGGFLGHVSSGKELSHGYTMGGNTLGCAAALATIDYFEKEAILCKVNQLKNDVEKGFKKFSTLPFIEAVQVVGYMIGIKFKEIPIPSLSNMPVGDLAIAILKKNGLFAYYEGFGKMFITPPLTLEREELDRIFEILEKTFDFILTYMNYQVGEGESHEF